MSQKAIKISGWALTLLLSLLFGMSIVMKLTLSDSTVSQAASLGMEAETYRLIGAVEALSLLLFIIPRTGMVGSLLLIAYMGGAIATHLAHHQPIAMAVTVQAVVWITAMLRFPEVLHRLIPALQPVIHQNGKPVK